MAAKKKTTSRSDIDVTRDDLHRIYAIRQLARATPIHRVKERLDDIRAVVTGEASPNMVRNGRLRTQKELDDAKKASAALRKANLEREARSGDNRMETGGETRSEA